MLACESQPGASNKRFCGLLVVGMSISVYASGSPRAYVMSCVFQEVTLELNPNTSKYNIQVMPSLNFSLTLVIRFPGLPSPLPTA